MLKVINFFVKNNTIHLIIGIPGIIMIVNLEIQVNQMRIKLNGILNEKTQLEFQQMKQNSMPNFAKIKKTFRQCYFSIYG